MKVTAGAWREALHLATVESMPTGHSVSAHRMRGVTRTAAAVLVTAGLTLGAVPAAQASHSSEVAEAATSHATYPAPGQPVITPPPRNSEATSTVEKGEGDLRVATLHADLVAEGESADAEQLVSPLASGNHVRARLIARTVQMNDPDVLVLTGVSYDESERIAEQMQQLYFAAGQNGQRGISFPHYFTAPTNSGQESGADLDGDGTIGGPEDALGYGEYPGQYGMIVFSKHPILADEARTFQRFLWRDLPENSMPEEYSELEEAIVRLQETSMWDVPIEVSEDGEPLHIVASSIASKVPSEADAARAEDIRRVLADYVSGRAWYLSDDDGRHGGIDPLAPFVVAGTPTAQVSAQPEDLSPLLDSPALQDPEPEAITEVPLSTRPGSLEETDPTATRYVPGEQDRRASFVLPQATLDVSAAGVFWPGPGEFGHSVVDPESGYSLQSRLVWTDLTLQD